MGSVVISGATSGAITLAVPAEAGTRTLTLPATTGTVLTNDISAAGDTSAGDAAAVGYTSAEGLILTGQGSTSDVTIKNDADTSVLVIPTGTTTLTAAGQVNVGAGLIAQTDSSVGGGTANSGSGRYFDIYNTGADANTFAILRIITQQVGSSSTTSADFAKYKNGALLINNNDTHANVYTALGVGGSERMRIASAGQVLINQTSIIGSDAAPLQVTGGSVTAVAVKGGTNGWFMAFYNTSNTLIGSIQGSTGSTTSFNTSSDYRLKENVDYTWDATSRLKQLKPARFNFIADADKTVDGFLAHEVSSIVPEAVTGKKDAVDDDGKPIHQGIDHSKLVPLLTASLQEALKRIDSLEEQVNALKGK